MQISLFRNRTLRHVLSSFFFLLSVIPVVVRADSIEELHALVDANDNAAAWSMAERLAPDNAGDPDFDFWYGLAAKASGNLRQAALAFERVLVANPENPRAKLELADTSYKLGDRAEARRLFEEVLATTPPEPVQQKIRIYLAALDAADQRKKSSVTGFVTVSAGHDSNVNNATSDATHLVTLPIFGPVPVVLPPSSLKTAAPFMDLKAGVDVVAPENQRTIRFLSASVEDRDNDQFFASDNSDYGLATVTGGWMLQRGTATWRLPITAQALTIEGSESRYTGSAGAEYSRPLSAATSWLAFGQAGVMRYPSQPLRNASLYLLGTGYAWNATGTPLRVVTTLHVGAEPTDESAGDYNGRQYLAVRANLRYAVAPTAIAYGGVGVQVSRYDGDQPVLGFRRKDRLADFSVGWQWQPQRDWNCNIDLQHFKNASNNNSLYDYDRTQVMLGSTWRF